jgi:hypothetical protein
MKVAVTPPKPPPTVTLTLTAYEAFLLSSMLYGRHLPDLLRAVEQLVPDAYERYQIMDRLLRQRLLEEGVPCIRDDGGYVNLDRLV